MSGVKAANLAVATSIADPATRKSIEQIIAMLQGNPLLNFSGRVVEKLHTKQTGTGFFSETVVLEHGLGFRPKDIIVLARGYAAGLTVYDYLSTDKTFSYGISMSSGSDSTTVRFLVGTFGGR